MDSSVFSRNRAFLMLAIDHQAHFKILVNPDNPESASKKEIIALKSQILHALQKQFTGALIDVEYGLSAYQGIKKPFLLRIEQSNITEENGVRKITIMHTVKELKKKGASGIKLLVHLDPENSVSLDELQKVKQVLNECTKEKVPLFLEVITYGYEKRRLSKERAMYRSIYACLERGARPSVFKLEYPGNLADAQKITDLVKPIPWILLSGGTEYESFKRELKESVSGGCRGFLAGRALWQDIESYPHGTREEYLHKILTDRFNELSELLL